MSHTHTHTYIYIHFLVRLFNYRSTVSLNMNATK